LFTFIPFDPSSSDVIVAAAVEKVRTGTFQLLEDTYFQTKSASPTSPTGPAIQLYLALAYSVDAMFIHPTCDQDDVRDALGAYETALFAEPPSGSTSVSAKTIDPLYFLAHVRLATLASNDAVATFLIDHFHSKFPTLATPVADGGWCNDAEVKLMTAPTQQAVVRSASQDGSETSTSAASSLEAIWEETKQTGGLTEDQIKPMDELFELTGLKEVKAVALKIYRGVLADKKLVEDDKADAVGERVLNFSFLGNPGTGKSTVGRLFSELLEASGARVRGYLLCSASLWLENVMVSNRTY
jgi:hypothetical protein